MIIPTGFHRGDAKWQPMVDWLTANRFDVDSVPTDALIEIRDGTCLGVELYVRDATGHLRVNPATDLVDRRTEWHPMVQPPPPILLPAKEGE